VTYTVSYTGPDVAYSDVVASWQDGYAIIDGLIDGLRPRGSYPTLLNEMVSRLEKCDLSIHLTDGTHTFLLERPV
jgi:hypothetical protein